MSGAWLVTGASRGIGAATAGLAAAGGHPVVVSYRRDAAAARGVVAHIEQAGGRAVAVQADVSREADVLELFAHADAAFGTLAVLINNAGVVAPQARVDQMDGGRLSRMFAINVSGAFLCAREAVRRMSTTAGGAGGSIVNVSSVAARHGAPGEYVDYAASKAAIDVLTLGLAKEVATEGIRVNAVRPGIIVTDIHATGGDPGRPQRLAAQIPLQRPGHVDEVARAIVWLAGPEASYCTGTILDVSGGR